MNNKVMPINLNYRLVYPKSERTAKTAILVRRNLEFLVDSKLSNPIIVIAINNLVITAAYLEPSIVT